MLHIVQRSACLLVLVLVAAGCFNFDFGSSDTEIQGCNASTPESVAMSIQPRYALGSTTTLAFYDLDTPAITSSNSDVVQVGPLREQDVTLSFVGEGKASITVSDATGEAITLVNVAPLERFEVVLPSPFYAEPLRPLEGLAVIDPAFDVAYFDHDGRLYGRGLADCSWSSSVSDTTDAFYNRSLEPGVHQVEVRVGELASLTSFVVFPIDQLEGIAILQQDSGEGRIRVDAVGLAAAGAQVWNISPYFLLGGDFYVGSFEYLFDPHAAPSTLTVRSISLTDGGPLDPVETTIYRAEPEPDESIRAAGIAPGQGRAPLMAVLSLLLIAICAKLTTGRAPAPRTRSRPSSGRGSRRRRDGRL